MKPIKLFDAHEMPVLIDKNQLSYDLHLAQSDEIRLQITDDYSLISSSHPSAMFNGVLQTSISNANPEFAIRKLLGILKLELSAFCWKVWSTTYPKNLAEILESEGLFVSSNCPGMAADLNAMVLSSQTLENILVKQVCTEQQMKIWLDTLFNGFQINDENIVMYQRVLTDSGYNHPVKHYLALYDGQAVATASSFFSDGVVGIYWVSTLPKFRGKGIACNMMKIILKEALSDGYRVAILQSSVKGFSLYQRMGFVKFCENVRYQWQG